MKRNPWAKKAAWVLLAGLFGGFFPAAASADPNPGVKLTRGIVNLTTGWLEVPAQMAEQKKTDTTQVWWIVHGLIRGIMVGAARTLYGAYDIITFPAAPYNAPMMDPDTLIKPKHEPREDGPEGPLPHSKQAQLPPAI